MNITTAAEQSNRTNQLQHRIEVDDAFLDQVLTPYRHHCRYLNSVQIGFEGEGTPTWDKMVSRGKFAIGESCYIDDTGHFNAVEFNICYNQLAYVHLAVCVREGLMPALSDYTLKSYFQKQLSNYLIASIHSHYHSELNPRDFSGEVRVLSARSRPRLSVLKTACRFHDGRSGRSDGEVKLVVLSAQ
ncbi:FcoT-like thioesterase domain protein [Roseimaritima multifibrata]|uniref:(2E)-enoyl-[ACP] glycyltransferase n=1 Tax=Roseimaritima multifibrata TaxID=1930274 RepID=A0A517MHQ0_9BACT|nr:FcoT family thioesterase [Roseimaritima multifibrata]QDS94403.1 FcoT-like thioesterase domain protein [Roseimaritima multifibrata]